MKLSKKSANKMIELAQQGRAIARAMDEHKIQKEKNMAKAEKRNETLLHAAADLEIGRNYS